MDGREAETEDRRICLPDPSIRMRDLTGMAATGRCGRIRQEVDGGPA